jgi:hypothetical protein
MEPAKVSPGFFIGLTATDDCNIYNHDGRVNMNFYISFKDGQIWQKRTNMVANAEAQVASRGRMGQR